MRPAFKRYGRNFRFDPGGNYTYQNIFVGNDVSIGTGAVLLATESKIIIGNNVMLGPCVTVIGGDHNTSIIGRFMSDVETKRSEDDRDVIIEDDVWVATRVVILKGVCLGRGAIIAAGAVVTRDVPPYTIVAGVPARVLRLRFGIDTILQHEIQIYPPDKRFSREQLMPIIGQYQ